MRQTGVDWVTVGRTKADIAKERTFESSFVMALREPRRKPKAGKPRSSKRKQAKTASQAGRKHPPSQDELATQAGGPTGEICEIEIDLPDYSTRSYRRSTSNNKGRKAASKGASNSKPTGQQPGAKQDVEITEMKPKRDRLKPALQPAKPETQRAALKRSRENAKKLQMSLF